MDSEHELIGYRGVGSLGTISSFGVIVFDRNSCGKEVAKDQVDNLEEQNSEDFQEIVVSEAGDESEESEKNE